MALAGQSAHAPAADRRPRLGTLALDGSVQAFVTVAAIILALWLVLYPLGWLIWGVLHKGAPGAAGDWTAENLRVLLDPGDWRLVGRSILVAVAATVSVGVTSVPGH